MAGSPHRGQLVAVVVAAVVLACSGPERDEGEGDRTHAATAEPGPAPAKITFDLEQLNENGLAGPPDGLRALSYEFCIPGDPEHIEEVRSIDPTIQLLPGGRGRVGCTAERILCIGSTHQPDFRGVLLRLAALPYIERIDQTFFE